MPLMGACSAVIAAGCHLKEMPEAERKVVASGKVSWCVIEGEGGRKWLGFLGEQSGTKTPRRARLMDGMSFLSLSKSSARENRRGVGPIKTGSLDHDSQQR